MGIDLVEPKVCLQEPDSCKDSKNGNRLEIAVQYCKTAVLDYVCPQFVAKRGCRNGPAFGGCDSAWEIRFRSEDDFHGVRAWV